MHLTRFRASLASLTALLLSATLAGTSARAGAIRNFEPGDVFASIGAGEVNWYDANGDLIDTLDTGADAFTLGMAFDGLGNLYVASYDVSGSIQRITRFSTSGALVGTYGSGFNAKPQSILFDQQGNALVGQLRGNGDVLKFDSGGALIDNYDVPTTVDGSNHIALGPDGTTLFYTSGDSGIYRYDLATRQPLPDFTHVLRGVARVVKPLADGTVLVAAEREVVRMDSQRNVLMTSDVEFIDRWYDIALHPDGRTFWASSYGFGGLCGRFDLATGALVDSFATGSPNTFGIAVFPAAADGAPAAPGNLTATLTSEAPPLVALAWLDGGSDEKNFIIERRTDEGEYGPLATVDADVTEFIDNTAPEGRTVTYRVRARNDAGVSSPSNEASVNIPGDAVGGTLKVKRKLNLGAASMSKGAPKTKVLKVSNKHTTEALTVTIRTPAPSPTFSVTSAQTTIQIPPRGKAGFTLAFMPDAKGKISGTVVLESSDPAAQSVTVALSGKGK